MKEERSLFFYLLFSIIAALLLVLFVGSSLSQPSPLPTSQKIGIACMSIFCGIVGISFVFKPNWLGHHLYESKNQRKTIRLPTEPSFEGHHPQCRPFQSHTIQWRGKTWCAGCLGLLIGLCTSIVLMILYPFIDITLTKTVAILLLLIGYFILAVVFFEIPHSRRHTKVHVFINSLMPLSFVLITIAVGEATGEFLYGVFSILLCFLWLDTRIQLSKSHHRTLCMNCSKTCKMFTESV